MDNAAAACAVASAGIVAVADQLAAAAVSVFVVLLAPVSAAAFVDSALLPTDGRRRHRPYLRPVDAELRIRPTLV